MTPHVLESLGWGAVHSARVALMHRSADLKSGEGFVVVVFSPRRTDSSGSFLTVAAGKSWHSL